MDQHSLNEKSNDFSQLLRNLLSQFPRTPMRLPKRKKELSTKYFGQTSYSFSPQNSKSHLDNLAPNDASPIPYANTSREFRSVTLPDSLLESSSAVNDYSSPLRTCKSEEKAALGFWDDMILPEKDAHSNSAKDHTTPIIAYSHTTLNGENLSGNVYGENDASSENLGKEEVSPKALEHLTRLDKIDEKSFELLLKACKGLPLTQKEQYDMSSLFGLFDCEEILSNLEKAQRIIFETVSNFPNARKSHFVKMLDSMRIVNNKNDEFPLLKISRNRVSFELEVNKEAIQEIRITNMGNKPAKFKCLEGSTTKCYDIAFSPKDGIVKKKAMQTIQIKIFFRNPISLRHIVSLEIEGGQRFYIILEGKSVKSVFGIDPSSLEMVIDMGKQIPAVLVIIKKHLYENEFFTKEGIFFLTGDEEEGRKIKAELNRGTFQGSKDVFCLANLIKVWFRELPQPVLNPIVQDLLLDSNVEESKCIRILESLPELNKSLVIWLLDLLSDIAAHEITNRVTPRSLAVVISPNLYSTINLTPMESLTLTQRVVSFVLKLIMYHIGRIGMNPSRADALIGVDR